MGAKRLTVHDIPLNTHAEAAGTLRVRQGSAADTGREAETSTLSADRSPDAAPTADQQSLDSTVGVAIVAHHSRLALARRLALDIAADHVAVDDGQHGPTINHFRAWTWLHQHLRSQWSVVLEDDAKPVPHLPVQLLAALNTAPAPIIGLYLGRQHPEYIQNRAAQAVLKATTSDACWITSSRLHHAVGVAIRTELLSDMLANTNTGQPIDEALSTWAAQRHHSIAYTYPSLIDHLDIEPVIRGRRPRQPHRRAWRFGHRATWSTTAVPL